MINDNIGTLITGMCVTPFRLNWKQIPMYSRIYPGSERWQHFS